MFDMYAVHNQSDFGNDWILKNYRLINLSDLCYFIFFSPWKSSKFWLQFCSKSMDKLIFYTRISSVERIWWPCNMLTCLEWTTFHRIPFPVCFCLVWALRDILPEFWWVEENQEWLRFFSLTCWFISLIWGSSQACNCFLHLSLDRAL